MCQRRRPEEKRKAHMREETPEQEHEQKHHPDPRQLSASCIPDDTQDLRPVERLIGLGATRVQWDKMPAEADYVILADPEGNRFCVIDKSE